MADYFITGKKGNGKSLCAVGRMKDYLKQGRRVATNLDIWTENLMGPNDLSSRVIRIPDKPTADDLELLGYGSDVPRNEERNGALILDELGTWLNSRSFQDKGRLPVIDWLLHARKLRWDVFYLVQDIAIVDKQVREALAEHVVYCRRLDRATIPVIGAVFRLLWGGKMPLPRIHIATVKYGDGPHALVVDRWTYKGTQLFNSYDTEQRFRSNYPHGVFTYLPGYLVRGRYMVPRDGAFFMRITKIYLKKYSKVGMFVAGFFLCAVLCLSIAAMFVNPVEAEEPEVAETFDDPVFDTLPEFKITGYSKFPGRPPLYTLDNGDQVITTGDLLKRGLSIVGKGKDFLIVKKGADHVALSRY